MSFAKWKKRSKVFLAYRLRSDRHWIDIEPALAAAYKAGQRDGMAKGLKYLSETADEIKRLQQCYDMEYK